MTRSILPLPFVMKAHSTIYYTTGHIDAPISLNELTLNQRMNKRKEESMKERK
jgi:hypothetical protein